MKYFKGDSLVIAVDFDGTCVTHEYPDIGKSIGAEPVLKKIVAKGHRLLLYTMRSGDTLDEAVQWFRDNDILLWGVNENPHQAEWSTSRKIYADLYIDDAALGCPLVQTHLAKRPHVDWHAIEIMLEDKGIL